MNKVMCGLIVVAGCIFLTGCGNQEEDSVVEPASVSTPETTPKPANNPLARQQQLLKDAKGIQSILDEGAEKKKKAADSAD